MDWGNIWDTTTDYFSSGMDTLESEWNDAVDALKKKAVQFSDLEKKLEQLAPVVEKNPQYKDEYDSLMSKAQWIKKTVMQITGTVDSAAQKLSGLGFDRHLQSMGKMGALEMGFLPVVPIAVILGASAAMTYWITDAYSLTQKLRAAERTGASASQTADILNAGSGGSIFSVGGAGKVGILLILGIGAFVFRDQLIKVFK